MIAESIEDVATVQSAMYKGLQTSESDLHRWRRSLILP